MAILTGEEATIPVITPDIGLLFTRHHVHPIRVIVRLTIRRGRPPSYRPPGSGGRPPYPGYGPKPTPLPATSSYNTSIDSSCIWQARHDACARPPAYSGDSRSEAQHQGTSGLSATDCFENRRNVSPERFFWLGRRPPAKRARQSEHGHIAKTWLIKGFFAVLAETGEGK